MIFHLIQCTVKLKKILVFFCPHLQIFAGSFSSFSVCSSHYFCLVLEVTSFPTLLVSNMALPPKIQQVQHQKNWNSWHCKSKRFVPLSSSPCNIMKGISDSIMLAPPPAPQDKEASWEQGHHCQEPKHALMDPCFILPHMPVNHHGQKSSNAS